MVNGLSHIIVIIVALLGIFTGYRRGFLGQIGGWLGVAFGIVATRMLAPDFIEQVELWIPPYIGGFKRYYVVRSMACGLIYCGVSFFVQLCAFPLGKILRVLGGGMFDSIAGAAFKLFKYLMLLSIVYNVSIDLNPPGKLAATAVQHDGNLVEGVVKIAPPILGFPAGEEVGRRQQLEEAKKIS